jgi:RNase P subunit RPR2
MDLENMHCAFCNRPLNRGDVCDCNSNSNSKENDNKAVHCKECHDKAVQNSNKNSSK